MPTKRTSRSAAVASSPVVDDAGHGLALSLAEEIRRDPGRFPSVDALSAATGLPPERLHGLFSAHHHLTPAGFLRRARVDAAARLLVAEPGAAEHEVASVVGFGDASTLVSAFVRRTGLAPGAYRRLGESPEFVLALPPGYLHAYTLRMLGRDPESATERVSGSEAAKGVWLGDVPAVLHFDFRGDQVRVRAESARPLSAEEVRDAHRLAVRVLGLGWDPEPFERRAASPGEEGENVSRLVEGRTGLRIPLTPTVFEGLVLAIVGQQVNLAFAYALRRALSGACGAPAGAGLVAHPSPAQVAALDYGDLTRLRFSRRKAEYLVDTARAVAAGALELESLPAGTATAAERTLMAVRGLGRWSAHYLMMRACGFGDCVPVGDAGLTAALQRFFGLPERPGPAETLALMAPFAPHRTLATHHLWMTLGSTA